MHGRVRSRALGIRPARPAESGWGQVKVNPAAWGDVDLGVDLGGPADMQLCSVRTFWTVPKLASDTRSITIPMGLDVNMVFYTNSKFWGSCFCLPLVGLLTVEATIQYNCVGEKNTSPDPR